MTVISTSESSMGLVVLSSGRLVLLGFSGI